MLTSTAKASSGDSDTSIKRKNLADVPTPSEKPGSALPAMVVTAFEESVMRRTVYAE